MTEQKDLVIMQQENRNKMLALQAEAESQRAITEVQAALTIAAARPRDETRAIHKITESCKRYSLASVAKYNYRRGNAIVSDGSVKLAEVMAQHWGNIDFGWKMLFSDDEQTTVECFAWDMETNTKQRRVIEVPHIRDTRDGPQKLTGERDKYELVANMAARRLRECVFGVIPRDVKDVALEQIEKTLADGGNKTTFSDRVHKMIDSFKSIGVTIDMLEKRLECGMSDISPEDMSELVGIFSAIQAGEAKREEFFKVKTKEKKKAEALVDKIKDEIPGSKVVK